MKKYNLYQLVADFGEVNEESENYREIFSRYQRQEAPKTLYGIDDMGNVHVIMSKG